MEIEPIILPTIKTISEDTKAGVFEIEPLHPGFANTIGNALRRVLLSSLPGSAVSAVKIEGVSHEYSTIPGVKEDVLNIIFNLKDLRVKITNGDSHKLILNVKGEKVVTAADIKAHSDVEILNPEQVIMTLTSAKAHVIMEITVENGRGYIAAEERREKRPIGEITLDSLFTPVTKVAFTTENTRVGQATNYDKISLDIETTGNISPSEALRDAALILVEQFSLIAGDRKPTKIADRKTSGSKKADDMEKMSVEELDLSTRTLNALMKNNIKTVDQLAKLSADEIGGLRGMGSKAQEEISEKLEELGIAV